MYPVMYAVSCWAMATYPTGAQQTSSILLFFQVVFARLVNDNCCERSIEQIFNKITEKDKKAVGVYDSMSGGAQRVAVTPSKGESSRATIAGDVSIRC